jgi:hypothetical protein
MLSDLEKRSSAKKAPPKALCHSINSKRTLVTGVLWNAVSAFGAFGHYTALGCDPTLYYSVQKGQLAGFRIDDSIFALGYVCDRTEWDDLVVELKKAS